MSVPASESALPVSTCRSTCRIKQLVGLGAVLIGVALIVAVQLYWQVNSLPDRIPSEDRIGLNAPFITTDDAIVDKMVELAELTADDVVYDLGCGDGRLVITAALRSGCRGVGIDIDPERVAEARANVELHGVADLVEIREQDVFAVDLREADVILMYLLPWMTKKLIPQFQQMPAGSRIVSHDFGIGDIKYIVPERTVPVRIEEVNETHLVHRWFIPLNVPPAGE